MSDWCGLVGPRDYPEAGIMYYLQGHCYAPWRSPRFSRGVICRRSMGDCAPDNLYVYLSGACQAASPCLGRQSREGVGLCGRLLDWCGTGQV